MKNPLFLSYPYGIVKLIKLGIDKMAELSAYFEFFSRDWCKKKRTGLDFGIVYAFLKQIFH